MSVRFERVLLTSLIVLALLLPGAVRQAEAMTARAATTGYVSGWGLNVQGQLGQLGGRYTCCGFDASPVPVSGITSANSVAAGDAHSLALKSDGTVWAWGDNSRGQLGNPNLTAHNPAPTQVKGIDHNSAIAAGGQYSLALRSDGTVWAWGNNTYGNLGDGTMQLRTGPVKVVGLTGVTAIAAGQALSVALKADGTVWAWGFNDSGQLGNGTRTNSPVPVEVQGLPSTKAIAAQGEHALAVDTGGSVWIWGDLSNGAGPSTLTPEKVTGLTSVVAVATAGTQDLALRSDGTVWRWLGTGGGAPGNAPSRVPGLISITAIAGAGGHMLALQKDGIVWGWGADRQGQAGSGNAVVTGCQCVQKPTQVPKLKAATAIAAGLYHSLAVSGIPVLPQAPPVPRLCVHNAPGVLLAGDSLSLLLASSSGYAYAVNNGSYNLTMGYQDCSGAVTKLSSRAFWTAPIGLIGGAVLDDAAGRIFAVDVQGARTNTASNVVALDVATGRKLKSIKIGIGAVELGADEATYRLFAVTGHTVRMIAVTRGVVLRTETIPTAATMVAVDQKTNRVYAVANGSITTLDGGTGEIVWAEQLRPGTLSGIGVDERTGRVFVAESGELGPHPSTSNHGTVSVLDARSGRLLHIYDMGAHVALSNVIVDQPAGRVLIEEQTNTKSSTEVRDARDGRLLQRLGLVLGPAAVGPQSGWVYAVTDARRPNSVSVLNPIGWRTMRTVKIGHVITYLVRDAPLGRVFLIDLIGQRNTVVRSFVA